MFNFSHFHKNISILVPKVCFFDATIHAKSEGDLILNLTKVIVNVNLSDPSIDRVQDQVGILYSYFCP